jgi:hypothetical protein
MDRARGRILKRTPGTRSRLAPAPTENRSSCTKGSGSASVPVQIVPAHTGARRADPGQHLDRPAWNPKQRAAVEILEPIGRSQQSKLNK